MELSLDQLKKVLGEAIQENTPDFPVGEIRGAMIDAVRSMPAPRINVQVPEVKVPQVNIPATKFPEFMQTELRGVNFGKPLPVILTNDKGEPYIAGSFGGGGGKGPLIITDILNIQGRSVLDTTNDAVKISAGASLTVAQLSGASFSVEVATQPITFEVKQVSGGNDSVNVVGFTASVQTVPYNTEGIAYNSDNPLPITAGNTLTTRQVSGSIDSIEIASQPFTLDIKQVSGSIDSINIAQQDITLAVRQVSGANHSIEIASQPFTLDVKQVSGSIDSINIAQQDISLIVKQVSGAVDSIEITSQPFTLDVKQVSGSIDSIFVTGASGTIMAVGDIASDVADNETAPIKVGGIARSSNPTAVADGDRVSFSADDVGRQITTPIQVRDLRRTAYATLSSNSETTLFAGVSGVFHDLVYVAFANTSSGAVSVDLRDATGGGVLATFNCPAEATQGVTLAAPIPQNVAADTWTVDFNDADITNTTVYVNALFSREV